MSHNPEHQNQPQRCKWAQNPLFYHYHDHVWGKPEHNDQKLFEFLVLETFQSGLSWAIVYKKLESFRAAFDNFDYQKVAQYSEDKEQELLQNEGIIRNRLKIKATITNAQAFIKIREEYGSFDQYIWSFVDHAPIQNHFKTESELPAKTDLSDTISKDLKKKGFKFIGSTVVYAHIQATGMVNDHTTDCFRHAQLVS